jgi:hypothetical protein
VNDQLHQTEYQAQASRINSNLDKFEWGLMARFTIVAASLPWSF